MIATLAGGCFWCLEAVFSRIEGIKNIRPGYSGGKKENASYEKVCSGKTNHVESIQFEYDENIIGFEEILNFYWQIHDPTTLNRQGNDVGPQYGAVIFYHNKQQKNIAEKTFLEQEKVYGKIVTKILPYTNFFEAEKEYFSYYDKNKDQPYCRFLITPKLNKINKLDD